jgi:formate dehydrogenase subunit gamma
VVAPGYLARFSPAERLLHWLLASTFFTMLATGLILYLPSLAEVAARRQLWKTIHLAAAAALWAGVIALAVLDGGRLRRTARQLDRFDDDDRRWLRWAIRRRGPQPPQGRFNAGQKLNAAAVAGLMCVFTLSGLVMLLAEMRSSFRGTSAILVHDLATYVSLPLILGHIYLGVVHPATRHALRGMALGSVREDWAREHHPKWGGES